MSINDTFIVIPLFPILVLFYFVMRDHMSWGLLALMMACLGWAYDARLIRSVAMSLRTREFTETGIFSGMSTRQILVEEHLPYVLPIVFSTTMNNINWSIGLEVTLSVLGFTDINTPTIGVDDLLGQPAHRDGRRHLVVDRLPGAAGRHDLHRPLPAGGVDERIHRPAQPPRPEPADERTRPRPSSGLRAYYRTSAFGVEREVRAVDDISLSVAANEIYGLAGESSCGKTTLIKTIAAAIRPPLEVLGGSVDVQLPRPGVDIHDVGREELRGDPLEAPLLHHAGLDERAEPGAAGAALLRRLRLPPHRPADAGVPRDRARPSAAPAPRARRARRLSAPALGRHAPARHHRARHRLPARIHHRRRADHGARRRRAEGRAGDDPRDPARAGLVDDVRHPRHGGARQPRRPPGHHVRRPAGRGRPHRRRLPRAAPSLHRAPDRQPAADRRYGAPRRAWRARRPTLPTRRRAAASIRAARSPWRSAGARRRRWTGWRPAIASPASMPRGAARHEPRRCSKSHDVVRDLRDRRPVLATPGHAPSTTSACASTPDGPRSSPSSASRAAARPRWRA